MSKKNQTHYDVALLLAVEALNKQVNNETKSTMLHALTSNTKLVRYLKVDETSDINFVAVNSEFTQIAVAGESGKVHVLNPITGLLEYPPIELGASAISDIIFSPDGSTLLIGGLFADNYVNEYIVYLFDAATGTLIDNSLNLKQLGIRDLNFIDDRVLVCLSGNTVIKNLYYWDYLSGEILKIIPVDHLGPMAVSDDKSLIAVAFFGGIQLFDAQTGELIFNQAIDLNQRRINSISFSRDDKILALGEEYGGIDFWDVNTQELLSFSLNHDGNSVNNNVDHLLFTGTSILISSDQNHIYFWDYTTGEELLKWDHNGSFFQEENMIVSPDDQTLIIGGSSGKISLYTYWENPPGRIPFEYKNTGIEGLNFSSTGDYAYTVISQGLGNGNSSSEDLIVSWDISTGEIASDIISTGYVGIKVMEISPDDNILAFLGENEYSVGTKILFFNLHEWELMDQVFHFEDDRSIEDFCFFPTGDYLAVISNEHDLLIYDYINAQVVSGPIHLDDSHNERYPEVVVSKDGEWVLVSEGDYVIRMYDSDTLIPTGISFGGHLDTIGNMDLSPEDKYLVSEGSDNQLILWNVNTGEIISKLSNLSRSASNIHDVQFSPDGLMVAVVYDDLLQFFDVPSLDPIGPPLYGNTRNLNSTFYDTDPLHSYGGEFDPGWFTSLVFSPNGMKLLVGGKDNMRLITLSVSDWIERACFLAGRNLTLQEWQTFLPFDEYQKTCPQYP